MGRRMDAERTNNGSGKRLSLYLDVNWKIRWAYFSRNYINNFTSLSCCSVDDSSIGLLQMLTDGLEWCGLLVDYCDVFNSCLDSHSDGTHSLQRIHCWDTDAMLHFKWCNANVNFWVNYSLIFKNEIFRMFSNNQKWWQHHTICTVSLFFFAYTVFVTLCWFLCAMTNAVKQNSKMLVSLRSWKSCWLTGLSESQRYFHMFWVIFRARERQRYFTWWV